MFSKINYKKNKHKQSTLRFVLGLIFFLFILVIIIFSTAYLKKIITSDGALPVRAIKIDGALEQISKIDIVKIVKPYLEGKNIATLDLVPLHNALLEHPWVARVLVSKKMPDTIVIEVLEHIPVAYWNDNGLYDAKTASVFYPDLRYFAPNLIRLKASYEEFAPEVYENTIKFMRILNSGNYSIAEVSLDNVRCYRVLLANGTTLILGRELDKIEARLKRFIKAFPQTSLRLSDIDYIDLRYDVGFAVKAKE